MWSDGGHSTYIVACDQIGRLNDAESSGEFVKDKENPCFCGKLMVFTSAPSQIYGARPSPLDVDRCV
jgi:hypothetical protein